MTALRELLALAWLRLTVLGARAQRRLRRWLGLLPPGQAERLRAARGQRPPVADPRGPERWRPPVEGVDYSPGDIDRELAGDLAAIGAALADRVGARERPGRRARRGRTAAAVAAALAVLAGGAVATAALLDATTGLPLIDAIVERAGDRDGDDPDGRSRPDPAPGAHRPSPPLAVPSGRPGAPGRMTVYVSAGGDVCSAHSAPAAGRGSPVRGFGCSARHAIAADLRRHGFAAVGVTFGPKTVIAGLARPGTEIVAARGPNGPMDVRRSRPWSPGAGLPAVTTVAVLAPRGNAVLGRGAYESASLLGRYRLSIRTPDGERLTFAPWGRPRTAQP